MCYGLRKIRNITWRKSYRRLRISRLLQREDIKFDIINLEKEEVLAINFLEYYRNIGNFEDIKDLIEKFNLCLIKSKKIIKIKYLDTILDIDDSDDLITGIFNKDFTKLLRYKFDAINAIPISDLMEKLVPLITKNFDNITITYRNSLIRSLYRGMFSENPEFEEFLINLVKSKTKFV